MGRYYNSEHFEGKFGFGVQPSDDPKTVYGMDLEKDVDEETGEVYEGSCYFRTGNKDFVGKQLNKQYDILGVPLVERRMSVTSDEELSKYFRKHIDKYVYVDTPPNKHSAILYTDGGKTIKYEKSRELSLAASRIALGIRIFSEIEMTGECFLWAEF